MQERIILIKGLKKLVKSPLFWVANILLGTAIGVHLQVGDGPLARVPLLDESWYLHESARLQEQGWPGLEPYVMSPGYTWLVAAAGAQAPGADGILSSQPWLLIGLQLVAWLVCGVVPGWVVWRLGERAGVTGRRRQVAALVAGVLMLGYGPATVYARTVLLDLPLASLVVLALGWLLVRPRQVWVAGLILGLAALMRAHVLLLVPLVLLAGGGVRRRSLVLAVVLALVPVLLAVGVNSRLAGRLAGPSQNAGLNLYLGQQAETGGLFTSLQGFDQARDPAGVDFLSARLGHDVAGPVAADELWRREAWRLVRQEPGRAILGWLRKLWLHGQALELSQVTPLGAWVQEAPLMRWLPVPWWLLVVAGVTGLGLAVRGEAAWRRAAWVLAASLVILVAVQSLFFVVSRYRLVLAPLLALLAGLGVLAWRPGWRGLPWLVGAVLLVIPWGMAETRQLWQGLEAQNLARRYLAVAAHDQDEQARLRADALLDQACLAAPRRWQPWYERSRNLAALGRHRDALQVLGEGTTMADSPRRLEQLRIGIVREMGRPDQAESLMASYLSDWPDDLDMLNDLMVLQGQRGRWSAAEKTSRRLLELAPGSERGWLGLAASQMRRGKADQARETLTDGLQAVSDPQGRALLEANLQRLSGS